MTRTAARLGATLLVTWVTASACSPERPADGERLVGTGAPGCAERHEGWVTPPATGVQLWYERIGDSAAPAIVFLNGSDISACLWSDEFVAPFVAAGYQAVRFDARDSGRSERLPWPDDFDYTSWTPKDSPLYPLDAHVDDLFGLLDALAIDRAHLVGLSQGGMIAQLAALARPERVASLALLSTSPSNTFDPDLEPPAPDFFPDLARRARRLGRWAVLQPVTQRPLAAELTEFYRVVSGAPASAVPGLRRLVDACLRHAPYNPRSGQGFAVAAAPSRLGRLSRIAAPTLILHGAQDPFFPLAHALAMAERIPGARLLSIPGLGHGLPIERFAAQRDALLENLARGEDGAMPAPSQSTVCPP